MKDTRSEIIHLLYDSDGQESSAWKQKELFSPENGLLVWQTVCSEMHISPDTDLVYVSASSNYPTHELAIFEYETQRRSDPNAGKVYLFAGDISDIMPTSAVTKAQEMVTNPQKQEFLFVRWDARNLPLPEESVTVLNDRKGWIWHCASPAIENAYDDVKESLLEYARYLIPGGCVVLDAGDGINDQGSILPSTEMQIQQV